MDLVEPVLYSAHFLATSRISAGLLDTDPNPGLGVVQPQQWNYYEREKRFMTECSKIVWRIESCCGHTIWNLLDTFHSCAAVSLSAVGFLSKKHFKHLSSGAALSSLPLPCQRCTDRANGALSQPGLVCVGKLPPPKKKKGLFSRSLVLVVESESVHWPKKSGWLVCSVSQAV